MGALGAYAAASAAKADQVGAAMSEKKQVGRPRQTTERKRPDASFNFGANARPKAGKAGNYLRNRYAGGGS